MSLSSSPLDPVRRAEGCGFVLTGDGDGEGGVARAADAVREGLPGGRHGVALRSPGTEKAQGGEGRVGGGDAAISTPQKAKKK